MDGTEQEQAPQRGSRGARLRAVLARRAVHLLGLAVVLPLVAVDPMVVVLLYDVEFLVLLGTVGWTLLRGNAGVMWLQVRESHPALEMRVALAMTRERPASVWEA